MWQCIVFHAYYLAFVLFFAIWTLWLIQRYINYEQFFIDNVALMVIMYICTGDIAAVCRRLAQHNLQHDQPRVCAAARHQIHVWFSRRPGHPARNLWPGSSSHMEIKYVSHATADLWRLYGMSVNSFGSYLKHFFSGVSEPQSVLHCDCLLVCALCNLLTYVA